MNCPNCGAPLHVTESDDSLRCPYCRSVYTPEQGDAGVRLLGEQSFLACPVCAVPLEHAALAGHILEYCTKCEGMLVSMHDFVALIDQLHSVRRGPAGAPSPDRSAFDRHLACPQCQRPMDTHLYEGPGNIVIDDCSYCFLNWLDKGELMRVVHAPDHSYDADQPGW
jgi:Zn-finger nucleic acid-binding protein